MGNYIRRRWRNRFGKITTERLQVPGGWIYKYHDRTWPSPAMCFVPSKYAEEEEFNRSLGVAFERVLQGNTNVGTKD